MSNVQAAGHFQFIDLPIFLSSTTIVCGQSFETAGACVRNALQSQNRYAARPLAPFRRRHLSGFAPIIRIFQHLCAPIIHIFQHLCAPILLRSVDVDVTECRCSVVQPRVFSRPQLPRVPFSTPHGAVAAGSCNGQPSALPEAQSQWSPFSTYQGSVAVVAVQHAFQHGLEFGQESSESSICSRGKFIQSFKSNYSVFDQ